MMKGVLIVHHGTADKEAKARSLDVLFKEGQDLGDQVMQCFVSSKATQDDSVLSLDDAMKKMCDLGVDDLHIYNTFVIPGRAYSLFLKTVIPYSTFFKHLTLEKPLLHENCDFSQVARILAKNYPIVDNKTYILVGHGSHPDVSKIYLQLEAAFLKLGYDQVKLAFIQGHPSIDELIEDLDVHQEVVICSLMMSAGHHVAHDVKDDKKSSIETKLLAHHFNVQVNNHGLLEYQDIRNLVLHKED